jgi:hypothetical protein
MQGMKVIDITQEFRANTQERDARATTGFKKIFQAKIHRPNTIEIVHQGK